MSWRQIVIDLRKKQAVAVREKDVRTGEVIERDPLPDEGIDDILSADFREVRKEELKQTIQLPDEERKKLIEKQMTFKCTYYRAVVNKKLIEIWYSEEIPLYPIKVIVRNPNATVKLVRRGEGWKSSFFPPEEGPPEE